jgi:hypothetical protein
MKAHARGAAAKQPLSAIGYLAVDLALREVSRRALTRAIRADPRIGAGGAFLYTVVRAVLQQRRRRARRTAAARDAGTAVADSTAAFRDNATPS